MRGPLLSLLLTMSAVPVFGAAPAAPAAPNGARALVFCAPGYPGTTQEAQPRMDELAAALGELAGWPKGSLSAAYFPQEKAGLARLAEPDVVLALTPLPFFLAHEKDLALGAKLSIVQQGLEATQRWALVAKKGTVKKPADLEGASVFSTAGYAPAFVTRVALEGFGPLPTTVQVTSGGQVLSALRKASSGALKVAVLLDAEQLKALPTLPFASELEVVFTGPQVPVAVVSTVGAKLSAPDWKAASGALLKLPSVEPGKAALEGVRLTGFAPLDEGALAAARKAYTR